MSAKRELSIKHSFMQELHGFPDAQSAQLWEKIGFLVENPLPDGKLKKKLQGKKDLYRLRVGDFRVFYSFGDDWIRLLGVRRRNERTFEDEGESLSAEAPPVVPADSDVDLDAVVKPKTFSFEKKPKAKPLPFKLSADWLRSLKIPDTYIAPLLLCDSEEALLAAAVPEQMIGRVVDNLFPRPLEDVLQQPDYVVRDTQDLIRYKEGTLSAFLLKLDPEQEKLAAWALQGPALIKGGAGTGKSTVALYRIKKLLEQPRATGKETILFTTYTRALQAATQQLLSQLLTPEQMKRVRVSTCDQLVYEIVSSSRALSNIEGNLASQMKEFRQGFLPSGKSGFEQKLRARALEKISDSYLLDELEWIIDGRGIATKEDYLEASRQGRGLPMGEKLRTIVWELYSGFQARLKAKKLETFSNLRKEALSLVQSQHWKQRFDYVLVDEAQDLSPVVLATLAELSKTEGGLFFAADIKQSIYSRGYTFSNAHPRLQFKGRTTILHRNYRSTREIDRAAFSLLPKEESEDMVQSESLLSGPLPLTVSGIQATKEPEWAVRFIRQMASHLRMKINSAAVLVPTQPIGEAIAQSMRMEGLPSKFFAGKDLDLEAPEVKVLTLHSAKGLEFPIVVICGLRPGTYPTEDEFATPEEFHEELLQHQRLLYVGMTRAMRGLFLIRSKDCNDPALINLDATLWSNQEVS